MLPCMINNYQENAFQYIIVLQCFPSGQMRGIILLIIIVLLLLIFFLDVGFHIVWFHKTSIPSPQRGFFSSKTPTHLWKFQLSSYILLLIFMHLINRLVSENPSLCMQMYFLFPAVCIRRLREPTTSQEIPIPSVGDYGYFLKLHMQDHEEKVKK